MGSSLIPLVGRSRDLYSFCSFVFEKMCQGWRNILSTSSTRPLALLCLEGGWGNCRLDWDIVAAGLKDAIEGR
jgi:hypothetical protein